MIGNAVRVMQIATGEREEENEALPEKDESAVALGRKGGMARARVVTLERRTSITKRAATEETFRRANFLGTVAKILAHELSHAHLQECLGALRSFQVPSWFVEGLAVLVSDGGAERVSAAARAAIRAGAHHCGGGPGRPVRWRAPTARALHARRH